MAILPMSLYRKRNEVSHSQSAQRHCDQVLVIDVAGSRRRRGTRFRKSLPGLKAVARTRRIKVANTAPKMQITS